MVAQRRFGPLVVMVLAGLGLLVARLFDVQVLQHEVWAAEAASLIRSARTEPYQRGTIRDREGRELVRDEKAYELEFCYRDFRRGHPLAQVAHALSTLELRAVRLDEALPRLETAARALVGLSPEDLDRFGRGQALPAFAVAATADPERELRGRRKTDLRFYVGELLHVARAEWKDLKPEEGDPARGLAYVELLARKRQVDSTVLLLELDRELAAARLHLGELAAHLPGARVGDGTAPATLEDLVLRLERQRRLVEDASADRLFEIAAGYGAGRVPSGIFERAFDLDWIAKLLRWDASRLGQWMRSRRGLYLRECAELVLPRALASAGLLDDEAERPARMLDELAEHYAADSDARRSRGTPPRSWREIEELLVLSELGTSFELPRGVEAAPYDLRAMPLFDEDVRAHCEDEVIDPWCAVVSVGEVAIWRARKRVPPPEPIEVARDRPVDLAAAAWEGGELAARWRSIAERSPRLGSEAALYELAVLATALESSFASEVEVALERLLLEVEEEEGGARPLRFSKSRLERAAQQERFVQKDRGNRPVVLVSDPGYDLVRLVALHPDRYRGFEVRDTSRRVIVARDPRGEPFAARLIGAVRRPSLRKLFDQADEEQELQQLRSKVWRSDADESKILELATDLYRVDEWTGGSGIEDYFDRELRGSFGYRETGSLGQREAGTLDSLYEPPRHGLEVELTLDLELSNAACDVLAHPETPDDPKWDPVWAAHPVGAIVLMTPSGEVLVAASEPTVDGLAPTPGRNQERSHARERTLRRPTFTPPGSVFKPFVAAYALDRLGFDPRQQYLCAWDAEKQVGVYGTMHCHGVHGMCDLRSALAQSCNCYFAQLGESMKPEDAVEMARHFGFGEPTGIRLFGTAGRSGLAEDPRLKPREKLAADLAVRASRMRFTNGLSLMEATPMQIARATAGLVTGSLPDVRIVRRIGGEAIPPASRSLGLSEATRGFLLEALGAVVDESGGSAHKKGLDRESLGFAFSCKTGSADWAKFAESPEMTAHDRQAMAEGKMRKHTWITGWFPRDRPAAILVVYLHDVSQTSSHTAVYVAAQFLRRPEVKRFVERSQAVAAEGFR